MFPEAEKVKEACQVEKKKGQGESLGNGMNKKQPEYSKWRRPVARVDQQEKSRL